MKVFPVLYKKTTTGAIQQWTISVEEKELFNAKKGSIKTIYGQLDGALQTTIDIVGKGKNIGKVNETNAYQQACAEAQSKWEGKKKKGYVENIGLAEGGNIDPDVIEGGIFPMLAQKWADHNHKIKFPAFIQRKYDGVRCIAVIHMGKATLWTRTRKRIKSMPHIVAALEKNFGDTVQNITFDGELYLHSLKDDFEQLTHLARPGGSPIEGGEKIEYHIYDIITTQPYEGRLKYLLNIWAKMPSDHKNPLVLVETLKVESVKDVNAYTSIFMDEGYEGSIVRNSETPYEIGKRSYGLQKVKFQSDSEFIVTGVVAGRGKMADCAIFNCKTEDGKEFSVKMKGSLESLKKYLKDPSLAIGKMLTVQYQNLSSEGIPRFPVGVTLRDYE